MSRVTLRRSRPDAGFTLIELLVVMTLLGVIGSIVVSGLVTSMQTTRDTQSRVEAMAELQRAAENVTRELRAACPIVGPTMNASTVTAAVQRGGQQQRHTFRFDAAAGTLLQGVQQRDAAGTWTTLSPGRVLLRDLVAARSSFEFLDDVGSAVVLPGDVRTIRVNLARTTSDADDVLVETAVSLRNGGRSCD
jgi:prepilin-type N-terminal cleavage/methylation domain-containing protein